MSRVSGKTFLLGGGCQKGGTTCLHDCLQGSDAAGLGFAKEYHMFDALGLETSQCQCDRAMPKNCLNLPTKQSLERTRLKKQFIENPQTYFEYFSSLVANDRTMPTADITPAYARRKAGSKSSGMGLPGVA